MTRPVRIDGLTFNSGTTIDCANADVIVLVGPNNSGKSRTLQELHMRLSRAPGTPVPDGSTFALSEVDFSWCESADELVNWLRANRFTHTADDGIERMRTVGMGEFAISEVPYLWPQTATMGNLGHHLIRTQFAGERLGQIGSPGKQPIGAFPDHPVQALLENPTLRADFESAFKEAFDLNLILDAWGGNIRMLLSRSEKQSDFMFSTPDGRPSEDLVARLDQLQALESQSDGVRSFAGILLTLLTNRFPIVLVDEPEAFLHPPQARLLGQQLAKRHANAQLIIATHSLDVLLGVLESGANRVQIVRLTRSDGVTSAHALAPTAVADLWRDALLRFSRTLDGLFHKAVIVGEGDTDTAFYSAVAFSDEGSTLVQGRHVMFTYPGGKQRIPVVTNALLALGVPVRVIVDFDALNDAGLLRRLVEGMGHEWTDEMARAQKIVDSGLRGSEVKVTNTVFRSRLDEIIPSGLEAREITRAQRSQIEAALRPETGWSAAKKSGRVVVPMALQPPNSTFSSLVSRLSAYSSCKAVRLNPSCLRLAVRAQGGWARL